MAIEERTRTYRNDPVLDLAPGDPIPTEMSGPFAVLVTPELAEYLLTFNQVNRGMKTKVAQYASDMKAGRWAYPTTSLHFDDIGLLRNGQNRLQAVITSQTPTWMRVEFGWANGSLDVMDTGSSRSTADTLRLHGIPNQTTVASAISFVHKYDETVGSSRSWMNSGQANYVPSALKVLDTYSLDEASWHAAVLAGMRICRALDRGLTPAVWAAGYFICARNSPTLTVLFFDQVASPDGPRSESAQGLRDYYLRKRIKDSKTEDPREHVENIVRAFVAQTQGKKPSFVRFAGFALSRVPTIF